MILSIYPKEGNEVWFNSRFLCSEDSVTTLNYKEWKRWSFVKCWCYYCLNKHSLRVICMNKMVIFLSPRPPLLSVLPLQVMVGSTALQQMDGSSSPICPRAGPGTETQNLCSNGIIFQNEPIFISLDSNLTNSLEY